MNNNQQDTGKELKAVDFFCGGGGMSFGMKRAGIKVIAGIDNDIRCKETYEANITGAEFIKANIFELEEKYLQNRLNLKKRDNNLVLIGCSPCQFWSIINTDRKNSSESKNLLVEFRRFVEYFKPGYVIVENVPGVLRKKNESGLQDFIDWLEKNKYIVHFDVHNTNDYGVPQNRRRFTLVANRVSRKKIFPKPTDGTQLTVRNFIGERNGFPKINSGNIDPTDFIHTTAKLSEINKKRIKLVKHDGGNRMEFAHNKKLQLDCFIGKDDSFTDTYGRIWWDKPAPTITTKFYSISNGRFGHPEEDRGLSIREGATLQSFPKDFKFVCESFTSAARIIGNAVPPVYAERIGKEIINNHNASI